ncbi:MAG: HNH endonuclease [Alphaproteobacteria bacterium]|nr:HNH endonuclease [Alphaproteobacteria bacterium]
MEVLACVDLLDQAEKDVEAGQLKPEELTGYGWARAPLFQAQNGKCAWCELSEQIQHNAVDHLRPKSVYWWLTWTWENLLFACRVCNRHKSDDFPLLKGRRLMAGEQPPGAERPALLDPADPNVRPRDHIQFRPVGGRWVPTPRAGSRRGEATIRILQLDRFDLLDRYQDHVEALGDSLDAIRAAVSGGDHATVQATWRRTLQRRTRPRQPLIALTLDVLDHHFPPRLREHFGLILPTR